MIQRVWMFNQPHLIEVDYTAFDSDVVGLIEALGLAGVGTPDYRRFLACALISPEFSLFPLCERYQMHKMLKDKENARLLRDICRRNSRCSKFSLGDPGHQLCVQDP